MSGKSLADYIAEAQRDPFPLPLPDGTVLSIPQPDVDTWEKLVTGADTVYDVLRLLAGDQYEQLRAALKGAPAGVTNRIAADMRDHFGLGN